MGASQNDIGVVSQFYTPRGYQKILTDGTVKALNPPAINTLMFARITPFAGDLRYRDDGVEPTGITGQPIPEGETFTYFAEDLTKIRFIEDTGSPATQINISYYSFTNLTEIPDSSLCLLAIYEETVLLGTQVVTQSGQNFTAEDLVGSGGGNSTTFVNDTAIDSSNSAVYHWEETLTGYVGTNPNMALILTDSESPVFPAGVHAAVTADRTAGVIRDQIGAVDLFTGVTMNLDDFVMSFDFNTDTGVMTLKYSEDNGQSIAGTSTVAVAGYVQGNDIFLGGALSTTGIATDFISMFMSTGESVQKLPTAGSIGYCGKGG